MLAKLHRYLGITLALLLLIIAVSGSFLLWADEYHQWRFPELRQELQTLEVDPEALSSSLGNASSPVSAVAMPRQDLPAYVLYHLDGGQSFHAAQDGRLIAHWLPLQSVYSFLFEIHVHLLAGEPGHLVTGFASLLLLVMLFSGIPLWWRKRKVFRLRSWRPKSTRTPELMSSHAAQGILTGFFLCMLLLTGAGMVFHEPTEALLKAIPGSVQKTEPDPIELDGDVDKVNWPAVMASATSAFPHAVPRIIYLPSDSNEPIRMRLKQAGELHPNGRSYLTINPENGAVLATINATQTGPGPTIYNLIYPLHSGKTGWTGYRLVLLIAALASAWLAVSGLWIYLRRSANRRRLSIQSPKVFRGSGK